MRCGRQRAVPPRAVALRQCRHDHDAQRRELCRGRDVLHPAPRRDAGEVDQGEHADERHPQPARPALGGADQPAEVLAAHHPDGGDRRGVDRDPLHPADHEPGAGAERVARVHVLASRARIARSELGEDHAAEEGDDAAQQPGEEGEAGAAELGGDCARRAEDSRAHHDPHDHGEPVPNAQRPFELEHRAQTVAAIMLSR